MAEFSTEQRSDLSRRGLAMPDGSFPIRNKSDLRNAISSYGRAKNPDAAKRWIIRRARELNALDMLPESWNVAQHSDILAHYGVKGMKWGVRRKRKRDASDVTQVSKGKLERQVNDIIINPKDNIKQVDKKVESELSNTKEGRAYRNFIRSLSKNQRDALERGDTRDLTRSQLDAVSKIYEANTKKAREIGKRYVDDYAGAALRDLNYQDTAKARAYVQNFGLLKVLKDYN